MSSIRERMFKICRKHTDTDKQCQDLIDDIFSTVFHNWKQGMTVTDSIITDHLPNADEDTVNRIGDILIDYTFAFERSMDSLPNEEEVPLLTALVTEENGIYVGYIQEESGCIAQGDSLDEVKNSLLDLYWIKKCVEHKQKSHVSDGKNVTNCDVSDGKNVTFCDNPQSKDGRHNPILVPGDGYYCGFCSNFLYKENEERKTN